jgi:hypothetical protein
LVAHFGGNEQHSRSTAKSSLRFHLTDNEGHVVAIGAVKWLCSTDNAASVTDGVNGQAGNQ